MAYNRQYGNNNYGGGNYQRNFNNNSYQQQQQQPVAQPVSPEEFIDNRLNIYQAFVNRIKEQGLDPADFGFALGAWVTSYVLETKRK